MIRIISLLLTITTFPSPSSTISTFRTFGKSENLSDNFTNFSPENSSSQAWLNYYLIKFPSLAGLPLLSSIACLPSNDSTSYSNSNSKVSSNNKTPTNKFLSSLSTYSIKSLVDCLPSINSNTSNSQTLESLAFNFLNFSFINSNNIIKRQHQEQHHQEQQFCINATNTLTDHHFDTHFYDKTTNDKPTNDKPTNELGNQVSNPRPKKDILSSEATLLSKDTLSSEAREAISNGDIFFNFRPGKPSTSASNISYITRISAIELSSSLKLSSDDLINNNFFTINYPSFLFPSNNIPLSDIDLPFYLDNLHLDNDIPHVLDISTLDISTFPLTTTHLKDKDYDSFNTKNLFSRLPTLPKDFLHFLFNYRLFFHTTFRLIEFNRQDEAQLLDYPLHYQSVKQIDKQTDYQTNNPIDYQTDYQTNKLFNPIKLSAKLPAKQLRKLPRTYYQIKVSFPSKIPTSIAYSMIKSYLEQNFSNSRALAVVHQNTPHTHAHVHIQASEIDPSNGMPNGKKLHFG